MPLFSIVVAARDAAPTLPATLACLHAQSFDDWEAVVVDDGSSDDTAAVVERHGERDSRVRLLRGSFHNVSAARNAGVAAAQGEWLLFLDADDSLFPEALSAFQQGIEAEASLDVICGGWVRVTPDGRVATRERWPITRDMFPVFARLSAFPIHSCVVRRDLVAGAQGFDPRLITCEEWDLWQRLARAGARFGSIEADVARYHMRAGSASTHARQMLVDGLRVIATGHSPDPRVGSSLPQYGAGLRDSDAAVVRYGYACWPAGLVLGSGGDARPLLDEVPDPAAPNIDPTIVAEALFRSATLPLCAGPERWIDLYPEVSTRLQTFVDELERRTGAHLLARRVAPALAGFVLQGARDRPAGVHVHKTVLHVVDIARRVGSVEASPGVERAMLRVEHGGDVLGFLELPVCGEAVPSAVVKDAIGREYGWSILGRFFDRGVYPEVRRRTRGGREEAVRHGVVLAEIPNPGAWDAQRHDLIGWMVFLQELWGLRDWMAGEFYDPDRVERGVETREAQGGWISMDVLDPPADWTSARTPMNVELTIGGMPVCVIEVAGDAGVLRAARLRALLTTFGGVEMVHLAVREALVGTEWTSGNLRELLAARRARTGASAELRADAGALSPRASHIAAELLAADTTSALVGARRYGPPGSAASRRAVLPGAAADELIEVARAAGEPVFTPPGSGLATRLLYAPELLSVGVQQPVAVASLVDTTVSRGETAAKTVYGRHHFEALFASGADPWRYTTPYEARKYEQTLSLIPHWPIGRALEVGCAEGHFTDMLAARVEHLVATDISAIGLERAAARCAARPNLSFVRLDIVGDPLPGGNDLIVCSEMLYFVGSVEHLRAVCAKLRDALRDGGRLITAHANVVADSPDGTAFAWDMPFGVRTIKSALSTTPGLQLVRELRTPLYSVLEFERTEEPRRPQVADVEYLMPARHIAETIRWEGNDARSIAQDSGRTLPILMYHRVSDRGSDATRRYRITPAALAEQLGYLRDAGFQSISLAEWTSAIHTRKAPGAGRVVLTFDDAYEDFEEAALPVLQQYGFGAALFVVTDRAGGTNAWDAGRAEPLRLMDWPAIARVAEAGIEIGAHSATHPPLTGLAPTAIVDEASRARAEILQRIGRLVTAFAYPYGDSDAVVEHLVGGCGFLTGVTCRPGRSALQDRPLRLPRIEITGMDSLTDFVRKVGTR